MAVFNNILAGAAGQTGGAAGGYEIERSLRFNSADSAYLNRTPSSAGNRKTWTWAGWVKRSALGSSQALFHLYNYPSPAYYDTNFAFNSSDQIVFNNYDTSAWNGQLTSTAVFRDCSAWYHIVLSCDTDAATPVKLYVNGNLQILNGTQPSSGSNTGYNFTATHRIGINYDVGNGLTNGFNGYLADVHFIDGQALDPTSFGEFDANGIWQPIDASGLTYGTNGFHLDFADNSTAAALGTDTSGAGNDWTVNNLSVASGAGNDSLVDSPTNGTQTDTGAGGEVVGNYATLNPLDDRTIGSGISNGNLDIKGAASQFYGSINTPASGKWYWEATIGGGTLVVTGIAEQNSSTIAITYFNNGNKRVNGADSSYGASFTGGDVIGVAVNCDNQTVTFYKNNVSQGSIPFSTGMGGRCTAVSYCGALSDTVVYNFGQRAFAYTAPSGFKALCTANLPDPTIADGSTVMDVVTYTGNGSTQTISGLNFSPDLVWMKARSIAYNHTLIDSVRGATKTLSSSMTVQEYTEPTGPTAFTSDGWSMNGDVTYVGSVNANTQTYVGWAWDAGYPATASTGAVSFDGPTDGAAIATGYLTVPSSTDFNFGTGDFTWEAFIYGDDWTGAANGDQFVIAHDPSSNSDISGLFVSSGQSYYYSNKASSRFVITGPILNDKRWYHIAASRESGTLRLFVDGISVGSASYADTYGDAPFVLGRNENNDKNQFRGFISNFRVIKGTALYTSNFTPPSTELTNVTNTKLLCCQSTTSATAAAVSPGTITANGDASATTYNPLDAFSVDGTGYSTTSAASITEGTIPLTGASVNRSKGFSIVAYTGNGVDGATIGHGLNVTPGMVIVKRRDVAQNWVVAHSGLTLSTQSLSLNLTTNATVFGDGWIDAWSSTTFTTNQGAASIVNVNANTGTYVAYCFAPVDGYSSAFTYTGNGSSNGPMVYLGFRPRFLLIKASSFSENWTIIDTARDTYNASGLVLQPNNSNAEANWKSSFPLDLLSNGFKLRNTGDRTNRSGATYIGFAFAENPFKYARAR